MASDPGSSHSRSSVDGWTLSNNPRTRANERGPSGARPPRVGHLTSSPQEHSESFDWKAVSSSATHAVSLLSLPQSLSSDEPDCP